MMMTSNRISDAGSIPATSTNMGPLACHVVLADRLSPSHTGVPWFRRDVCSLVGVNRQATTLTAQTIKAKNNVVEMPRRNAFAMAA